LKKNGKKEKAENILEFKNYFKMKITVLVDNAPGGELASEHGLSYFIEHNNYQLLFDTGHSDLFLRNAEKLGIDLAEVETVVLSHGHWDHGNGLVYLKNKTLISHPYVFIKRYRKEDNSYIGLNQNWKYYNRHFKLISTRIPYKITDSIYFLGEIPRLNDFESKQTSFVDQEGNDDFVIDDTALAFILKDEIAVVTACSHSGVCNIIEHAKKVTGIENVKLVIGGFHLKKNDETTKKTIKCLKENNINKIYPSHCTQLDALTAFREHFDFEQVKTGMTFSIE